MNLSRSLLCVLRVLRGESPDLDLRPNPGPEQLPPELSWELIAALGLIGLVAVAAAAVLWLRLRRPREKPRISPSEWALGELARIESNGEDLEHRYARVADVLRHYLSVRFQLPANTRTTFEFEEVLQACSDLLPEQKASIARVLGEADMVKFARGRPTGGDVGRLADSVRNLIRQTEERSLQGRATA